MLINNFIIFGMAHLIRMMSPLLILPILSNRLSSDLFGLYMYAIAVSAWLVILMEYGFNISSTRDVAQSQSINDARIIFKSTQSAKCMLSIVAAILFGSIWALIPFLSAAPYVWMIFIWLFAFFTALTPYFYFQGKEKFVPISIGEAILVLATMPAIYFFVKNDSDILQLMGILLAARIIFCTWLSFQALRELDLKWNKQFVFSDGVSRLMWGWNLFLFQLASSFYTSSNTVYLGFFCSPTQIGVYATAEKVVKSSCGMMWQLSSVLFPRVNLLKGQNQSLRLIRLVSILAFMILAICSAICLYIFSDHIAIYMNLSIEIFSPLLQLLLLSIPAIVMSSILGLQYLVVERMEKAFGIIVFIGGLLNISMAYFLINALGPDGMAISWVLTEWVVLLMIVGAIYIYRQKLMK